MENFEALLQNAGFDVPDVSVVNTGETFEFFKHCKGNYSAVVGNFNVDYVDVEGKKCKRSDVGAKRKDFGMLDLILTKTPDNHGFRNGKFEIEQGQQYGEFIFKLYVPFQGDRQFQNKNFFDTFRIAGAPSTAVIQPGVTDKEFVFNATALGFYRGAPVSFEIKISDKGNAYVVNLQLQDNLLTTEKFQSRNKILDEVYAKLNALREVEKEQRKANKAQSEDDRVISGNTCGNNFSSQPSPEDIMNEMMGGSDEYK